MEDYWQFADGVSVDDARAIALLHGFDLEIGRVSRFDNARGVIIARIDMRDGTVNKLLLAEEIQHGLDRPTAEASKAVLRGISSSEFHVEVFQRILAGTRHGRFPFLLPVDVRRLESLIRSLQRRRD